MHPAIKRLYDDPEFLAKTIDESDHRTIGIVLEARIRRGTNAKHYILSFKDELGVDKPGLVKWFKYVRHYDDEHHPWVIHYVFEARDGEITEDEAIFLE